MPKFGDYSSGQEIRDIMEAFLDRFPQMFEGFDANQIFFIQTEKKKSREPIKVRAVGYPMYVLASKLYIVEVFGLIWKEMDQKKKNLAVFKSMCAIPDGAFDEQSKQYGKKLQPDIKMYMREYAASGGVPNWMDNPAAKDPMERTAEEVSDDVPGVDPIPAKQKVTRKPVTKADVESVVKEPKSSGGK